MAMSQVDSSAPGAESAQAEMQKLWRRRFLVFLASLSLWRLLYLYIVPLDLVPDEAYYWDWSRRLDWGYFSKPPMVAWLNALASLLPGTSDVSVRVPAVLLSSLGLYALYLLARRLYNEKVAFWAAVCSAASPGSCALGLLMTIDAPLLFFWAVSLYGLWLTLERAKPRALWASLTALSIGLGMLSKQMMLVFPILMFVFLVVSPQDRKSLKAGWPYLVTLGSLCFLLPPIWWNWRHDWITFQHTSHHFIGNSGGVFRFVATFAEFIGLQSILVSPVTYFLIWVLFGLLLTRFAKVDRKARFLLVFSAVPLIVFVLFSFRQRIQGNWPAAFYPAVMILLAAWGCGEIAVEGKAARLRHRFQTAVRVGAVLAFLTYLLPFVVSSGALAGGPVDFTVRLRGWSTLGEEVGQIFNQLPRPDRTFIVACSRQVVSELAFYIPGQPHVYRWTTSSQPKSQYEIWKGPVDKLGWDALILLDDGQVPAQEMVSVFREIEALGTVEIAVGPSRSRRFGLFLGKDLLDWPHTS